MPQSEHLGRTASSAKMRKDSAIRPQHEIKSRWERHLGKKILRAGASNTKSKIHIKDGFQEQKGGQAKRDSQKERESMSKKVNATALQDDLGNIGFTRSLAKLKIEKEVERRRARS